MLLIYNTEFKHISRCSRSQHELDRVISLLEELDYRETMWENLSNQVRTCPSSACHPETRDDVIRVTGHSVKGSSSILFCLTGATPVMLGTPIATSGDKTWLSVAQKLYDGRDQAQSCTCPTMTAPAQLKLSLVS